MSERFCSPAGQLHDDGFGNDLVALWQASADHHDASAFISRVLYFLCGYERDALPQPVIPPDPY